MCQSRCAPHFQGRNMDEVGGGESLLTVTVPLPFTSLGLAHLILVLLSLIFIIGSPPSLF